MTVISAAEAEKLFVDLAAYPAVVLAISGGPDSTALLLLAARWRRARQVGPDLLAVTVDHGLRRGSAREADTVKRLAGKLGVGHETVRWTGKKPATRIQEKARAARYRALAEAAARIGAPAVVTAHTLDDQAETVLLRLCRGSGLAGLAGMSGVARLPILDRAHGVGPRRKGKDGKKQTPQKPLVLVRPFLGVLKARLLATLDAAGITYADDPSNRDPRFTRARLRQMMPALAAEGLDAARLALLSRRAARAEAALEATVDAALQRLAMARDGGAGVIALDARGVATLPAEIMLRLLGNAIGQVGGEGPVELGKLEVLADALALWQAKHDESARFRRTLAGALVTCDDHRLVVERAPARRRTAVKPARSADSRPHLHGNR
jgi:tRNA(Ile)-lysidine synthase